MIGKIPAKLEEIRQDGSDTIISFRISSMEEYNFYPIRKELGRLMAENKNQFMIMIDKFSGKRSLDQNAYLWHLLTELAGVLKIDKDEAYEKALMDYGHWGIEYGDLKFLKQNYRVVNTLKAMSIEDHQVMKAICYMSSTKMSKKDFSRLLDGVKSDCIDQGIDPEIIRRQTEDSNEE